jgi:hypothetical protein
MPMLSPVLSTLALGLALFAPSVPKPSQSFHDVQQCRVNNTIDLGCFKAKLPQFEAFVVSDDAGFMQKSIVAESLVKYYDAANGPSHVPSVNETTVRTKATIYAKALLALDKSELGQIGDCKDEGNPDSCLKFRYCFKEAYIKIKNVLVLNQPELFAPEIKHFDKDVQGYC